MLPMVVESRRSAGCTVLAGLFADFGDILDDFRDVFGVADGMTIGILIQHLPSTILQGARARKRGCVLVKSENFWTHTARFAA
jgi:hypothetical protein